MFCRLDGDVVDAGQRVQEMSVQGRDVRRRRNLALEHLRAVQMQGGRRFLQENDLPQSAEFVHCSLSVSVTLESTPEVGTFLAPSLSPLLVYGL